MSFIDLFVEANLPNQRTASVIATLMRLGWDGAALNQTIVDATAAVIPTQPLDLDELRKVEQTAESCFFTDICLASE